MAPVVVGSVDGTPCRASATIPPRTKRQVKERDHYRCTVPWCRSAANIDVHHMVHREHGGTHEPENLTSLCYGHHSAHHRGDLLIEGIAPQLSFRRTHDVPPADVGTAVAGSKNVQAPHVGNLRDSPQREALLALTALGFKKRDAEAAVGAALVRLPPDACLEALLRAALQALR